MTKIVMSKEGILNGLKRCQKALDVTINKVEQCNVGTAECSEFTLDLIVGYLRDVFNAVDAAEKRQTFDDLIKD